METRELHTSLLNRFSEVETHLRKTFDELQQQVQSLQEGVEADISRHLQDRTLSEAEKKVEPSSLEGWVLHDEVLTLPVKEQLDKKTVAALVLQEGAEVDQEELTAHPTLRLNSHLMELSMKAQEAVGAGGREKFKSEMTSHRPSMRRWATRNTSSGQLSSSQFDRCDNLRVFSPNSKFRICWDIFGAGLIYMDAFVLPLCIAWNLTLTPFPTVNSESHTMLHVFAAVSLIFWPADIYLNFSTGFYLQGALQLSRKAIACRYIRTWFLFDLCVVSIDISAGLLSTVEEESQEFLQSLRSARYLRILRTLRIFRILKAGKINLLIENLVISMGRQWLILAFTVGRMLLAIGMVAHIMACIWFGLGQAVSETNGGGSWIDVLLIRNSTGYVQYSHALAWILLPPAPPMVEPDSGVEMMVCIFLFVMTVLVIGSALSILTGTLHEIRQVNNERSRKRRELRIFLQTKAVPTELLMRIMSYADYKMARQSPIGYDTSLISPMLEAELATFQFGGNLQNHPFFQLTSTIFPQVFAEFCSALQKQFFSEGESVFSIGSIAEMMYITSHGDFSIGEEDDTAVRSFTGAHNYFAEVALYVEAVTHQCTLAAHSFAEVFVLAGTKLAAVLANSPMCTTMFVEYANEYIRLYSDMVGRVDHPDALEMEVTCAEKACFSNSFYLDLNVDERKILRTIDLRGLEEQEGRRPPIEFIEQVMESNQPDFLEELRMSFVELDQVDGLHARYGELKEQEKVESGILSLLALTRNDYEAFTAPQKGPNRLTTTQWQQLQGVLEWAAPTPPKLVAAIWLLAVRPLGKYRSVTSQVPAAQQRPDQAVRYILAAYPLVAPTGACLEKDVRLFVTSILELQLNFNFAQMLQGENVPANLLQLKEFILKKSGEETLKFYVLFLLGFLSGLAGGSGSRFMNCSNARSTIPGLHILMRVLKKDPTALYWTYIHNRAVELGRKPENTADLAVVRLACLCRAQSAKDLHQLQESWQKLSSQEQGSLLQHFLADGVVNQAIVFEFLPLCLERAKNNAFVTIPSLLQILVELLAAVRAVAQKAGSKPKNAQEDIEKSGSKLRILAVDLGELAGFILLVQNSYIFQTCLCRAKLRMTAGRLILEVSQENWRRVREAHTDVIMLANSVRELVHQQRQDKEGRSLATGEPLNLMIVDSEVF